MASIYKRKSKDGKSVVWRAVVRIKGYPTACNTFDRNEGNFTFTDLAVLLKKYGYSEAKKVSDQLVEIYTNENHCLGAKMRELEIQKKLNTAADCLNCRIGDDSF